MAVIFNFPLTFVLLFFYLMHCGQQSGKMQNINSVICRVLLQSIYHVAFYYSLLLLKHFKFRCGLNMLIFFKFFYCFFLFCRTSVSQFTKEKFPPFLRRSPPVYWFSNRIMLIFFKVGHSVSGAGRNYSALGNVLAEYIQMLGD